MENACGYFPSSTSSRMQDMRIAISTRSSRDFHFLQYETNLMAMMIPYEREREPKCIINQSIYIQLVSSQKNKFHRVEEAVTFEFT